MSAVVLATQRRFASEMRQHSLNRGLRKAARATTTNAQMLVPLLDVQDANVQEAAAKAQEAIDAIAENANALDDLQAQMNSTATTTTRT